MPARSEKWLAFDERQSILRKAEHAPAFIQEIVKGLWCVLTLNLNEPPVFGRMYRMLCDPPSGCEYEPMYNDWPGDHRGWMRFESKESARDFYQFATGKITYDEYGNRARKRPLSNVRINLDATGNFT